MGLFSGVKNFFEKEIIEPVSEFGGKLIGEAKDFIGDIIGLTCGLASDFLNLVGGATANLIPGVEEIKFQSSGTISGSSDRDILIGFDCGTLVDFLFSIDIFDLFDAENWTTGNLPFGVDDFIGRGAGITINGNGGSDVLFGFGGNTELNGGSGDDFALSFAFGQAVLSGSSGDDVLIAAAGASNIVFGGSGNDTLIIAGAGKNDVDGGFGSDFIIAAGAANLLRGRSGDDTIIALGGANFVYGGADKDILAALGASNVIYGDANSGDLFGSGEHSNTSGDDDVIVGVGVGNFVFGEQGDDILVGLAAVNVLDGGQGDDLIIGGAVGNFLLGDDGGDLIFAVGGLNFVDGGAGDDVIVAASVAAANVLAGGDGADLVIAGSLSVGNAIFGDSAISIPALTDDIEAFVGDLASEIINALDFSDFAFAEFDFPSLPGFDLFDLDAFGLDLRLDGLFDLSNIGLDVDFGVADLLTLPDFGALDFDIDFDLAGLDPELFGFAPISAPSIPDLGFSLPDLASLGLDFDSILNFNPIDVDLPDLTDLLDLEADFDFLDGLDFLEPIDFGSLSLNIPTLGDFGLAGAFDLLVDLPTLPSVDLGFLDDFGDLISVDIPDFGSIDLGFAVDFVVDLAFPDLDLLLDLSGLVTGNPFAVMADIAAGAINGLSDLEISSPFDFDLSGAPGPDGLNVSVPAIQLPDLDLLNESENGDVLLGVATGANVLFGGEGSDIGIAAGLVNIIYGGDDGDLLIGAGKGNLLAGGDGDDILTGIGVLNTLAGGDGNDLIGGAGKFNFVSGGGGVDVDVIVSAGVMNVLFGGAGGDLMAGGGRLNLLVGGAGADFAVGGGQFNVILGGDDDDLLLGGGKANVIEGGDGRDMIIGGGRVNILRGGADEDIVIGGGSYNGLFAGEGDDFVIGGGKFNLISADSGDDMLFGAGKFNTMLGGDGDDAVIGGGRFNVLRAGAGQDIVIGGGRANTLDGGSGGDWVLGGGRSNTLFGGDGDDLLFGAGVTNKFNAGEGQDNIFSGAFGSTITGHVGDDAMLLGGKSNLALGSFGDDLMLLGGTENAAEGGSGADMIFVGGANNIVDGGDGFDLILAVGAAGAVDGGAGNDILIGGGTELELVGGDDADLIIGAASDAALSGGAGGDLIIALGAAVTVEEGDDDSAPEDGDVIIALGAEAFVDAGEGDNLIVAMGGAVEVTAGSGDDVAVVVGAKTIVNLGDGANEAIGAGESLVQWMQSSVADDLAGLLADNLSLAGSNLADFVDLALEFAINPIDFDKSTDQRELAGFFTGLDGLDAFTNDETPDVDAADTEATLAMLGLHGTFAADVLEFFDNIDEFTIDPVEIASSIFDSAQSTFENTLELLTGVEFTSPLPTIDPSDLLSQTFLNEVASTWSFGDGNDIVASGIGVDVLEGGGGNDTYVHYVGDGIDIIRDAGGADTLQIFGVSIGAGSSLGLDFGVDGIEASNIIATGLNISGDVSDDLLIRIEDDGGAFGGWILIEDHFVAGNEIEALELFTEPGDAVAADVIIPGASLVALPTLSIDAFFDLASGAAGIAEAALTSLSNFASILDPTVEATGSFDAGSFDDLSTDFATYFADNSGALDPFLAASEGSELEDYAFGGVDSALALDGPIDSTIAAVDGLTISRTETLVNGEAFEDVVVSPLDDEAPDGAEVDLAGDAGGLAAAPTSGVGFSSTGPVEALAPVDAAEQIKLYVQTLTGSTDFDADIDAFFAGLDAGAAVVTRKVEPLVDSSFLEDSAGVLKLIGAAPAIDAVEALVIDARDLDVGVEVALEDIDFAFIVGDGRISLLGTAPHLIGDDLAQALSGADADATGDFTFNGGNDVIEGTPDDDTLDGGDGDDDVNGGLGDDHLIGGGGADILHGGQSVTEFDLLTRTSTTTSGGDDLLEGGDGADTLEGGDGDDVLRGGDGDDVYIVGAPLVFELLTADAVGDAGSATFSVNANAFSTASVSADADSDLGAGDGIDRIEETGGVDEINFTRNFDTEFFLLERETDGDLTFVFDVDDQLTVQNFFNDSDAEIEVVSFGIFGSPAFGVTQSINSGAGDDFVVLTNGDDTADAGDGADFVFGFAGEDNLTGGLGDDVLRGGDDNDTLFGGDGADDLDGGDGDDRLDGGVSDVVDRDAVILLGAPDELKGGDGDDTVIGGAGSDNAQGGNGADVIWGDFEGGVLTDDDADDGVFTINGIDGVLDGGAGDDTVVGGGGSDQLIGGDGDDMLFGDSNTETGARHVREGDDTLEGGRGDDVMSGAGGDDTYIYGFGDGDDTIRDVAGTADSLQISADVLTARQDGDDLIIYLLDGGSITIEDQFNGQEIEAFTIGTAASGSYANVIEPFVTTNFALGTAAADTLGPDASGLIFGLGGDDAITGDAANEILLGGDGDDVIDGSDGDDHLAGANGDDELTGGAGDDVVYGGLGDDVLTLGLGADQAFGSDGKDMIDGGAGDDDLSGEGGDDKISGGLGADLIDGGDGEDMIDGNAGDDQLVGGADNDMIDGGDGEDDISGGGGDDILTGGAGDDVIDGGDSVNENGQDVVDNDIAVFSGERADYDILRQLDNSLLVTHRDGGGDGVDVVSKVEFFQFADETLNVTNGYQQLTLDAFGLDEDADPTSINLDADEFEPVSGVVVELPTLGDVLGADNRVLTVGEDLTTGDIDGLSFRPFEDLFGESGAFVVELLNILDQPTRLTLPIEIAPVNDAPDLTAPTTVSAVEDTPVDLTGVTLDDIDSDTATVEIGAGFGVVSLDIGANVIVEAGDVSGSAISGQFIMISGDIAGLDSALATLSYQGDQDAFGIDTVAIEVTDDDPVNPQTATTATAVNIAAVNDAPVAPETGLITLPRDIGDAALSLPGGSDVDLDGLVYAFTSAPTGGAFSLANGGFLPAILTETQFQNLVFTPDAGAGVVSESVSYTVSDGFLTDTGTFEINYFDDEDEGAALNFVIIGDSGVDNLFGGIGDDLLQGGAGNDFLTGGDGADIFVLTSDGELDVILDFDLLTDQLQLASGLVFEALVDEDENDAPLDLDEDGETDTILVYNDPNDADVQTGVVLLGVSLIAPRFVVPEAAIEGDEDTDIAISGIEVFSVAAGDLELTLTAESGLLTLDGDVGQTITLTGQATDLTTLLEGLIFTPDADAFGPFQILLEANDLGNLLGAPVGSAAAVNIDVANVDDGAPVPVDGQFIIAPIDAGEVAMNLELPIDPDDEDLFYQVDALPLAALGAVTLPGGALLPVSPAQFDQIDFDALVFAPTDIGDGTFVYTVFDGNEGFAGASATVNLEAFDGSVAQTLIGGAAVDTILGGDEDDRLEGAGGNDLLLGGDGDDAILGEGGGDDIDGGAGADVIFGGADNDAILGGAGDDEICWSVGDGVDIIDGGDGVDLGCFFGDVADGDVFAVGETTEGATEVRHAGAVISTLTNVESLLFESFGGPDSLTIGAALGDVTDIEVKLGDDADVLNGEDTTARLTVDGGAGDDSLTGGVGADLLEGDDGDDVVFWSVGAGDDDIHGGSNNDAVEFDLTGAGNSEAELTGDGIYTALTLMLTGDAVATVEMQSVETVRIESADQGLRLRLDNPEDQGVDTVEFTGGDGDDAVSVAAFTDVNIKADGGEGNDSLLAGHGDDVLDGADGDDVVFGRGGNDTLVGGKGNDTLVGNGGTDRLLGETGDDVLTGGGGRDVFVFRPGSGNDEITDFTPGIDAIRFNAVDFTFGDLTITQSGADVVLETPLGDTLTLRNLSETSISANDFLFVDVNGDLLPMAGDEGANVLIGGGAADLLRGLGGDDVIIGGGGNDTLDGGAGADRLLGLTGDDILIGGTGQDVFVFHTNNGDDIIADYEDGIDRMRFNGVTFDFGDLAISDDVADRLIATPDGNSVTLAGQAGLTLTEDDFLFA